MAKVATIFKVYSDQSDALLQKVKTMEPKPTSVQLEDIGFGIKVIKVMFVHEDQAGSTSYEEALRKLPEVKDVEVDEESLL